MARAHLASPNLLMFHCPGCGYAHGVSVNSERTNVAGAWGWNGSLELPTITPSILCFRGDPENQCHSFVKDGQIQYLEDCFHSLKGTTVDLPEWE